MRAPRAVGRRAVLGRPVQRRPLALALARTAATRGALLVNYCAATGLITRPARWRAALRDTRNRQTTSACGRAAWSTPPGSGWMNAPEGRRGQRGRPASKPHGGAQPGRAPGGGPRVPARRPCADGAQDRRRPGAVCRALAGQGHPGHHRHAAQDLAREPDAFSGRGGVHPGRVGPLPGARRRQRADVRSIWVGLRPLVKPQDDDGDNTKG
jgi:glycerol-3-phosphate dehydrogenase